MSETTSREAESYILGSMMLSTDAYWEIANTISAPDFGTPTHQDLFAVIARLAEAGGPVDPIAVVDACTRDGIINNWSGGASYVFSLQSIPTTWTNVGYYANIVRQAAMRRRLRQAGEAIALMAEEGTGDVVTSLETARSLVEGVSTQSGVSLHAVGESLDDLLDSLKEPPRYVPSPWKELNTLIGGFRPGCLYVFGGRPGDGKTILGLQIAASLAVTGPVVYVSLEMSEAELQKRLLAQFGSVGMGALANSNLTTKDWERLESGRVGLDKLPLYIDDRAGSNMPQIKAYIMAAQRRAPLAGVVVDYLQMIPNKPGETRGRHEIVGEMSREFKELARDLGIPVIVLSQLNNRDGGKAGMGNLRDSGDIEHNADVVVLLSRDAEDRERQHILTAAVPKNRHGASGSLELLWEGYFSRVRDMNIPYGNYGHEGHR